MSATSWRSSRRTRARTRSRSRCATQSSIRLSSQDDAAERARLAEQLITAEQDERRRLALFLHDGPVQSLAGIALMLDAVRGAIDDGNLESAKEVLDQALIRHRDAIRSLRDLSFSLEPVVL